MPMRGLWLERARSDYLDDFVARSFAERTPKDGKILAEDGNLAAMDCSQAGHNSVPIRSLGLRSSRADPVPNVLINLDKRASVKEGFDSLPSRFLPLGCCFAAADSWLAAMASWFLDLRSAMRSAVDNWARAFFSTTEISLVADVASDGRRKPAVAPFDPFGTKKVPPVRPRVSGKKSGNFEYCRCAFGIPA